MTIPADLRDEWPLGDSTPELLQRIRLKCEQFWNEHNLNDAEVHVTLEFIHSLACKLIARAQPSAEGEGAVGRVQYAVPPVRDLNSPLRDIAAPSGPTDSERIDWLERQRPRVDLFYAVHGLDGENGWCVSYNTVPGGWRKEPSYGGDSLRAAIDAAISTTTDGTRFAGDEG